MDEEAVKNRYAMLLSQERRDEIPPISFRPPATHPAKYAVLYVMSTNCWLSVDAIRVLLKRLGYKRSKSSIRRALHKCLQYGLVVGSTFTKEANLLRGKRGHRHTKWRTTERGRQAANSPRILLK